MLEQLQANILSAHVRDHLSVLLLRFDAPDAGRRFLRTIAPRVKSAYEHLEEKRLFASTGRAARGAVYVGVGLTRTGYATLGVDGAPDDLAFVDGMPAGGRELADPPVDEWDEPYRGRIDAVVLIGDATRRPVRATRAAILGARPPGVVLVGEETGLAQHDHVGRGIEHFGFADGRSQPLFLDEEIRAESRERWDPSAPLEQVLVADPGVVQPEDDPTCFGSYLVFRKLEQDVRAFAEAEAALARQLDRSHPDPALAGAMVMGRFRDGTPLVLQAAPGLAPIAEVNDFDYRDDPGGARCPLFAHTRKVNPRGSGGVEAPADERAHLMARRGQAYGERSDDPADPTVPPHLRPTGGVGLLFMAVNSSITLQFVFAMQTWVNTRGFPQHGDQHPPGLDPIIGQGTRAKQAFPARWGVVPTALNGGPFEQAVTMRGGAYCFLPSLPFLRDL